MASESACYCGALLRYTQFQDINKTSTPISMGDMDDDDEQVIPGPSAEVQQERAAYLRWRIAAQRMQAAHAEFVEAKRQHDEALIALGNVVAPPVKQGG